MIETDQKLMQDVLKILDFGEIKAIHSALKGIEAGLKLVEQMRCSNGIITREHIRYLHEQIKCILTTSDS